MQATQGKDTKSPQRELKRRRKTLLACNPCRSRKTRCDGGRPHCTVCTVRGANCIYEQNQLTSQPSLAEIRARLEILEKDNVTAREANSVATPEEASQALLTNEVIQIQSDVHAIATPNEMNSRLEIYRDHGRSNTLRIAGNDEEHDASMPLSGNESESHEMNRYPQSDNPKVDRLNSSNISFLDNVAQASKSTKNQDHLATDGFRNQADHALGITPPEEDGLSLDVAAIALPERHLADDLLANFWENVHPIFPVLHRPSMIDCYEQLWVANRGQRSKSRYGDYSKPMFHAILNILLAIGCQYSNTSVPQQSFPMADLFYQRSKKLIPFDELDNSLSTVQLLLLTGIYLQSTRYLDRCWNTIGLALRIAQGLGLHINKPISVTESQKQREMRRRVWYICVMMDRLTATTFGRPTLLSRNWPVPLPLAVDDEVLSETSEGVQPPGTHSQLDGFVHSLGFFDLLGDVLSAFYIPAEEQSSSRMSLETQLPSPLSTTLELNSRLDEFLGNLPHHLQLHREINLSGIPDTGFFELQARTLHFRSLYLRILLLRPYVLSRIQHGCNQDLVTNSKFISVLEQRVSTELIQLCLSTAHTVINNLHDQIYGSNPSPSWHAVYFAFAAATVIVAASHCSETRSSSDLADTSWDKALEIFHYNRAQSNSVHEALKTLKTFRGQVSKFAAAQGPAHKTAEINTTIEGLPDLPISNFPWDPYDVTEFSFFDTIDTGNFQSHDINSDPWK
ncbi:fungal-specific transcription factor domain-containing protein [Halenospora varia]|nr:fungal-specific transcription factor domain-containing protein [Halenospora varia]